MSNISGIAGSDYYRQIASGTRLERAADGAAELAIAEKENAQIRGLSMGKRNAEDGKSLLNTADGAMNGIADNLSRIRELAVQASNTAILSKDDQRMIQDEIDQLKQGISDIANNTEFNKKSFWMVPIRTDLLRQVPMAPVLHWISEAPHYRHSVLKTLM